MPNDSAGRQFNSPLYNSGMVSLADSLTNTGLSNAATAPQGTLADSVLNTPPPPKVSPFVYLGIFFLFLIGMKFASEHERAGMDPQIAGIGIYNWVAIGLMSTSFLIVFKTLVNKYHVTGLTELVNVA